MGLMISAAGWILEKVGGRVVESLTDRALERSGVLNATCQNCLTAKHGIEVHQGRPSTLVCERCGHQGTILIESLQNLTVHQVQFASIIVQQASISIRQPIGPQDLPGSWKSLKPLSGAQSSPEARQGVAEEFGKRLPAPTPEGYGALIDAALLPNEGTPLPPAIVGLLKKSLAPRDQRISDPVTWHKTLSKLMIDGQYSPTTFNLAFFMHNLFRDEIERESQEVAEEKNL